MIVMIVLLTVLLAGGPDTRKQSHASINCLHTQTQCRTRQKSVIENKIKYRETTGNIGDDESFALCLPFLTRASCVPLKAGLLKLMVKVQKCLHYAVLCILNTFKPGFFLIQYMNKHKTCEYMHACDPPPRF